VRLPIRFVSAAEVLKLMRTRKGIVGKPGDDPWYMGWERAFEYCAKVLEEVHTISCETCGQQYGVRGPLVRGKVCDECYGFSNFRLVKLCEDWSRNE
jgi:hypothetical protein